MELTELSNEIIGDTSIEMLPLIILLIIWISISILWNLIPIGIESLREKHPKFDKFCIKVKKIAVKVLETSYRILSYIWTVFSIIFILFLIVYWIKLIIENPADNESIGMWILLIGVGILFSFLIWKYIRSKNKYKFEEQNIKEDVLGIRTIDFTEKQKDKNKTSNKKKD